MFAGLGIESLARPRNSTITKPPAQSTNFEQAPRKKEGEKNRDKQRERDDEINNAQIAKLKNWTEKPFPIHLRSVSKTPYLHQFSSHHLREGLIHAITTRNGIEAELIGLLEIWDTQYSASSAYEPAFRRIREEIRKAQEVAYDVDAMMEDEVLDGEGFEQRVREWVNATAFGEERVLRYTLCVVARRNDQMINQIVGMRRSLAVAQGDADA